MGLGSPLMEKFELHTCQLIACMYAIYVANGSSVYCQQVSANTVGNYVRDMASLVAMGPQQRDIRKDNPIDTKNGRLLTKVFDELKRYDQVPNRREPLSPAMLSVAKQRGSLDHTSLGPDSALADWYEVGLLAGLRNSEWAQDSSYRTSHPRQVALNVFNDPTAFCLRDIRVETHDYQQLQGAECYKVRPEQVRSLWLTFRTQKNGDYGEQRMFTRNPNPKGFCMISAMFRILDRFAKLIGKTDLDTPLAVYRPPNTKKVLQIHSGLIERHMRSIAMEVYHLDPHKDHERLQRWSSHSLRVGACVALHCQGFTATQLKWLLRWRSDSFMIYLRNISILADQHNKALDEYAKTMPQVI